MKLFDNRPLELIALTRNQKVCGFASRKRNPFRYPRPEPSTVYNLCRGDLNYYRLAISTPKSGWERDGSRNGVYVTRDDEKEKEKIVKIPSGVMKSRERSKVSRHAFDEGGREREREGRIIKEENKELEGVTRWFTATPRRSERRVPSSSKNETCPRTWCMLARVFSNKNITPCKVKVK